MIPQGPECATCPYAPDGIKFIPPDGSGASRILLVGDSPWLDEQKVGLPFSGAAGRMLNRILQFMPGGGLKREDLTIWNTIQCSPPHLGWMDAPRRYPQAAAAVEHCRPHLDQLIGERQPKVIVPMGNVALRRVCGISGIEAVAGYVLPTSYGIPAVPTYHPSFLLKGKQNLIPVVLWALSRAQSIADGSYKESEYELLLDPDPEVLRGYLRRLPAGGTLFIDIETPESGRLDEEELEEKGTSFVIIRAGFSVVEGSAASFPWTPPYIEIFKEAVALAGSVVEWADNRFDTRRLAAAGVDFSGKQIISGMWAWHWLQSDLRKGLDLVGPFFYAGRPWKHLSQAEPAFYNAMDNSVGMDCYIGIHKALVEQGRWEAFLRYCVQPTPIFESMGRAGLLINTDYRTEFMNTIRAERDEINGRIQALVPDNCRPRKFWKRPPKDMTGVVALDDVVPPNGAREGLVPPERPCGDELSLAEELFLPNEVESSSPATGKSKRTILPYKFMRVESFNAGSWQQVQDLARSLGVKLPRKEDAKDDEDTSTDEKALKRAMKDKKHGAVFKAIYDWRKRNKLITSYSWPLTTKVMQRTLWVEVPVAENQGTGQQRAAPTLPRGLRVQCAEEGDQQEVVSKPLARKEAGDANRSTPSNQGVEENTQGQEDSRVQPQETQALPHPLHLRGSWSGETPSSENLPNMPEGLYPSLVGREALHPSLGLGQVQQFPGEPAGRLCFVPQQVSSGVTKDSAFLLPVERTHTENRVHYSFTFAPSTWRKSCKSVNIQTIPKRSDLAKKFRRMIVAAPTCVLIEGDSAAIEAVILGWLAGSKRYIRLAKAGVHGWLTSALHGIPIELSLSDTALAQECRNAKKQWPDDYEKCKRVTHLTGYLGTPRRIFEEYPDDFSSEAEARKLQQFLLATEAGQDIKAWQKATVEEAHGNRYLENFYGLRHRFYTLFQWNPRRQAFEFGDDAKRAVAFRPQSIASFIQTDVVLRMVEWGWLGALRAIIHDSIVMEVPEGVAMTAGAALYKALIEPREKLGGLEIGAEVSIGRNLAPQSDENPDGMVEMSQWQPAVAAH